MHLYYFQSFAGNVAYLRPQKAVSTQSRVRPFTPEISYSYLTTERSNFYHFLFCMTNLILICYNLNLKLIFYSLTH